VFSSPWPSVFVREWGTSADEPADLRYTALTGKRAEKHSQLTALSLEGPQWRGVRTAWQAPFMPAAEGAWDDYPALNELFPWTVPGVKPNRTWVYAPYPSVLKQRWRTLVTEPDLGRKRGLFKETRDRSLDRLIQALPGQPTITTSLDRERHVDPPLSSELSPTRRSPDGSPTN
jgi:hypothetical protein